MGGLKIIFQNSTSVLLPVLKLFILIKAGRRSTGGDLSLTDKGQQDGSHNVNHMVKTTLRIITAAYLAMNSASVHLGVDCGTKIMTEDT